MQTLRERLKNIKVESNTLWGGIAIGFMLLLLLLTFIDTVDDPRRFSQVVAGGLYQGMLVFMVAAGLSIVFGLMDVLNLAQGSLLMIGAYVGWDILTRLSGSDDTNAFLLSVHVIAVAPLFVLLLLELTERLAISRFMQRDPDTPSPPSALGRQLTIAVLVGAPVGVLVGEFLASDFSATSDSMRIFFAVVVTGVAYLEVIREPILFALRWAVNEISMRFQRGLAMMMNQEPPTAHSVTYHEPERTFDLEMGIRLVAIGLSTIVIAAVLNGTDPITLRFGLAAVAATFAGAVAGTVMEVIFIRPTYVRPFFQIVLTFGLALVIREAIIFRYDTTPKGTLAEFLPTPLQGTFPPAELEGLFPNLETTIFNYWIFMIVMGALMMIGVQVLLMRTRIGIIIRAGVQDSEMVEALGVNVRLVFTAVFTLGGAIAALGGIISGGFINIDPILGDLFLLQAVSVVIIGGLGSYAGTALASILVGITRSVTAYFSRQQFNTDGWAPIAVLALLCIVLLIKPSGLFGREH